MARIILQVPYCDKDEVKARGGLWDPQAKTWFAPDGVDPSPFAAWMEDPSLINVRSASYFIAASVHNCPKCAQSSRVHGFILPEGHTLLNVGEEEDEDEWEVGDEPSLLCSIEQVTPSVALRVRALTLNYRPGYSRDGSHGWLNYCEHCGTELDDDEVFCEPGMGFLAFTEEDARRVTLLRVHEEFGAACGSYSFGVALFEEMKIF
jgi:hypothetical protein